ncbi:MAG: T9SS type A sorting domain-containing protein [Bacteroidetes bacterium]|nr:T9SS type A sorting domain-containing protein [Bacteroidota bacterium]
MKQKLFLITFLSIIAISGTIDLDNLFNYANQPIPVYIQKDNTPVDNPITDMGATLGRVLFYDKQLSVNGTVSCASCHHQEFGFSDTAIASIGVNGTTGRHAMRLVNARFAIEGTAFWNERAATFEAQATLPIQDHAEMGFSGQNDDPGFDSLIHRMENLEYYPRLFGLVYGDSMITEERMQKAIAQFVRSIQSFDAKYDTGAAMVPNPNMPFPNFSQQENMGKMLFTAPPVLDANGVRIGGGAGCAGCHQPPEFDIDPIAGNNGIIGSLGGGVDLTNTRAPSLRDLVNPQGQPNGPYMHTGVFTNLMQVVNHYDSLLPSSMNPMLDNRLRPMGNLQNLQLTQQEKNNLVAFLHTLTGHNIYTDEKWADPFVGDSLVLLPELNNTAIQDLPELGPITLYPNPATDFISIEIPNLATKNVKEMRVFNIQGQVMYQGEIRNQLDVSHYPAGYYFLTVGNQSVKFIKR